MTYPIPAYAISVWVAGDSLMIAFPGTVTEKGHTIKLPASAAGLDTAVKIAKARAEASDLRIGNRGTPTQYDVEAGKAWGAVTKRQRAEREAVEAADKADALARHTAKKRRAAREKEEAETFLKELGL